MLWPNQTEQSIPRLAQASLFAISGASAAPLLARPAAHDRFSASWPTRSLLSVLKTNDGCGCCRHHAPLSRRKFRTAMLKPSGASMLQI
jgi:hypothetical protein